MAIGQIRIYDDNILRKKCKTVIEVNDKIRQILEDMIIPCIIQRMKQPWSLMRLVF